MRHRVDQALELERYLRVLAGRVPGSALLELRFRRPGGWAMRQRFYPAPRSRHAAETALWLAERNDVYVGVVPRTRRAGGRTALERAWSLWADCDDPEAILALERFAPAPAIVVDSGRGRHAYWPLAEPVAPEEAEERNRRLATALGADPASCDAARILRPPGTSNHKYRPPAAVELVRFSGRAFAAAEVTAGLPPAPRRRRAGGTARASSADRLLEVAPAAYVKALTGLTAGRDRKVACPFHEDSTPSLHVYEKPAEGWFCFGCRRGGSVYDLAAELWGVDPRGRGFIRLRQRLEAELA